MPDRPPVRPASRRAWLLPGTLIATAAILAATCVVGTLRRPPPPSFVPASQPPREVGDSLVGPTLYTVDARDQRRWRWFDFSRGAAVESAGPAEWDLAFRRHDVLVNGGAGFGGQGGAIALGGVAFDSLIEAPEAGYLPTEAGRDSIHPAFQRWYDYGFTSHLLEPKEQVYAIRTADGRYAKLEIVSYYCPEAVSGCLTFRYTYQGSGSRRFRAPDPAAR
jgi:hypothetical protein